MKKMIALVLAVMLLCPAFAALAEAMKPMYATVGDALAKAGEYPIAGGEDGYYVLFRSLCAERAGGTSSKWTLFDPHVK